MKQRHYLFIVPIFLMVCFLGFNFGAQKYLSRFAFDATQDRIFTLSPASKTIIEKTQGQIVFNFYFSRHSANENPLLRLYGARVRDVLKSYARASGGKILFKEHDVAPFSAAEDEAIAANLLPWRDSVGAVSPIYLGLVATKANQSSLTIRAFMPENEANLEYDISRLIANLNKPKIPIIGLISDIDWFIETNSMGVGIGQNSQIAKQIGAQFEIVSLAKNFDRLPNKMDALFIAQPFELSEFQQYLIDQYIVGGGRVLLAQDAASSISYDNKIGRISSLNSLGRLSVNWGYSYSGEIIADKNNALLVQSKLANREALVPQPLYFSVNDKGLNRSHIVTSNLRRGINLATPSHIVPKAAPEIVFEPLLKSSDQSMALDVKTALDAPTPQEIESIWSSDGREYILAAAVSGKIRSAFPDGPPNSPIRSAIDTQIFGPQPPLSAHLNSSQKSANIIVIADVDFLSDGLFMESNSPSADNLDFVMNAIEFLSGDSELINLRSKAKVSRKLKIIDEISKESQAQALENQTRLEGHLRELQQQLQENQALGFENGNHENNQIRKEIAETRAELRGLEGARLEKIDSLKAKIIFVCAGLVPLVLLIFGLLQIKGRQKFASGNR